MDEAEAKRVAKEALRGLKAQKIGREEELAASNSLLELRKTPLPRPHAMLIAMNPSLPGKIGDFDTRFANVRTFAQYYADVLAFLKAHGHLFLQGRHDDLYHAKWPQFTAYHDELAPYLGSRSQAVARRTIRSIRAGTFELFFPLAAQLASSIITPFWPTFAEMNEAEYRKKRDMVADFVFGDPLKFEKTGEKERAQILREIAEAASELNRQFVHQHTFLANTAKRESIVSSWLSQAQRKTFYSIGDKSAANAPQTIEAMLAERSVPVEQHEQKLEETRWDHEDSRLLKKNLTVEFRTIADKGGKKQEILVARHRFAKGKPIFYWRALRHAGWYGSSSSFAGASIDIPLSGNGTQAGDRKNLADLFFLMGIPESEAAGGLDRQAMEKLLGQYGYAPKASFRRGRNLFVIDGKHLAIVDRNIEYQKPGAEEWRRFGHTVRFQSPVGKQPSFMAGLERKAVRQLNLKRRKTGPADAAIRRK